jgi:hypothetical protein
MPGRGTKIAGADHIGARRIFAAYGLGAPPLSPPDGILHAPVDLLALIPPLRS